MIELRDYFAAHANEYDIEYFIDRDELNSESDDNLYSIERVRARYRFADAMLRER